MNSIVIEHVNVTDLPDSWRERLAAKEDAQVTVRIEEERSPAHSAGPDPASAFGMWSDRTDLADVPAYVRSIRASRY